ncbi:MAG TPA: hypothetical protein VMC85_11395 [Desulfomonilaceae bacterium]|nr:hypothetical protein [Desulfomonilaceae bacterium]
MNAAELRVSDPIRWYWALAVAAIAVMIVGGWGTLQLWRERYVDSEEAEAILNLGAAVHIHCAIDSHLADGTFTPEKMALAMGPRYIGLVSMLEKTLPKDFLVPVAHQCSFDGRNYVHIIIKKQSTIVSLIITRKEGRAYPLSSRSHVVNVLGLPLHQAFLRNLEVAGFETREYLGFIVSGLDREQSYRVASDLALVVWEYLRKLEM